MEKLHCLAAALALVLLGISSALAATSAESIAVSPRVLPGPIDASSLGFGSTGEDVLRLAGRPSRVAAVGEDDCWFYGLSTITLHKGTVAGWTQYDRQLPLNIGGPAAIPTAAGPGRSAEQVVAALGTPKAVVRFQDGQLWFYGTRHLVLSRDEVIRWAEVPGSQQADHERNRRARGAAPPSAGPSTAPVVAPETSDLRPTAHDLWAAFLANEFDAEARFMEKVLTVSGRFVNADRDFNDTPRVTLSPGIEGAMGGVRCLFGMDDGAKLRGLKTGQAVKIRGKCEGLSGIYVLLTNCNIQPLP